MDINQICSICKAFILNKNLGSGNFEPKPYRIWNRVLKKCHRQVIEVAYKKDEVSNLLVIAFQIVLILKNWKQRNMPKRRRRHKPR